MISPARASAALVVALAAVPLWLVPGVDRPAAARQPAEPVQTEREVEFDDCTFKLVNNYSPEDGGQFARTRQVRSEETCRFGARNRTIRVRACFQGRDGSPVDCSDWLLPTSTQPYAESVVTGPAPKDSIHYVEIRGEVRRFDLAAPQLPPAPPPPPPASPPAPPAAPPPPAPAPSPTPPATDGPSPATPGLAGPSDGGQPDSTSQPELWEAASQRPDTRLGLAAGLAVAGVALLGLGGTGLWLLRRSRAGTW